MSAAASLSVLLQSYIHRPAMNIKLDETTSLDLIEKILLEMQANNLSLQDILGDLENDLTGDNQEYRHNATVLISLLFKHQKFRTFSPQELHLFIIFFCRRLQDFPSINPSLQGLYIILSRYGSLLDPKLLDIVDVLHSLTREIHIPSYAVNIRHKAMEIIALLLSNDSFLQLLESENNLSEYFIGVIHAMEGEKDPRCLFLDFQIMNKLCLNFPGMLTEKYQPLQSTSASSAGGKMMKMKDDYEDEEEEDEFANMNIAEYLFDNSSCYFPISFVPPPDDPFKITPESLSKELFHVLTSSPAMLKLSIPFFIDQIITNDSEKTRIESLSALIALIQQRKSDYRVLVLADEECNEADAEEEEKGISYFPEKKKKEKSGCCGGKGKGHSDGGSCGHHHHGAGGGIDHDHSHDHQEEEVHSSFVLEKLSNLLYDILINEGQESILDKANELMCLIIFSLSKERNQFHSKEKTSGNEPMKKGFKRNWRLFIQNLLVKAKEEIFPSLADSHNHEASELVSLVNIDSLKARNAWKLILLIGSSGGISTSNTVVVTFLPVLLPLLERNYVNLTVSLKKMVVYSYQRIHVLNSLNSTQPVSQQQALQADGRVIPLLMNMLENLITIGLPERIDISQFQEFSAFIQQNYHVRIFELLFYHYFSKVEIDLSNVIPVVPNQRKRERPQDEENNNPKKSETQAMEVVVQSQDAPEKETMDSEYSLTYFFAIRATKELLKRLKGKDLSADMLSSAFNRLFNLYNDGFPSFFQVIRKNDANFSYDLHAEFQLEKENKNLMEEISSSLVVLSACSSNYNNILLQEIIPSILNQILNAGEENASSSSSSKVDSQNRKKLLLSVLSKMVCANEDIMLLEFLFQFFQKNFFSTLNGDSSLSSQKLIVFNEMMELFAKIMKSDHSLPVEKKASFKKKADVFIGLQNIKKTTPITEYHGLIGNSVFLNIFDIILSLNCNEHHFCYSSINHSFFQLLQAIFVHFNKDVQEILFSQIMTKLNQTVSTVPNHNWSSWKRECMFYLLLSADKQISYFQENNPSSAISNDLHSLYHLSLEWISSADSSMISDYELNIAIYTMAIMINKAQIPALFNVFLYLVLQEFQRLVDAQEFSKYFFRFYFWVTKALIIRSPMTSATSATVAGQSAVYSTWQELFLQTGLSLLARLSVAAPAAEGGEAAVAVVENDEKQRIFQEQFSQYASEFFTILLSPLVLEDNKNKIHNASPESNKPLESKHHETGKEMNKEQSLKLLNSKLFAKEHYGNSSLFWYQKLFGVVLPFLSNEILPPSTPVAVSSSSSSFSSPFTQSMTTAKSSSSVIDEQIFKRKFIHYIFLCQLISLSPSSIRKLNISTLFDCFKMILTACNQMEKVSSASQTAVSLLEKELFPSLELLIQESPVLFGDSLHLIIPRLIKVAQESPVAKTRAMALECLSQLPKYLMLQTSYAKLFPYQKNVIIGLKKVLDDKKRAIRQLAMKVCNEWILIDTDTSS